MGNNSTKESRGPESSSYRQADPATDAPGPANPAERHHGHMYSSRTGRASRPDLSFLGIGTGAHSDVPERRETKQEREARKLEKERVARLKERERSIKEEHVDGGYLVTMGVYTGPEDFNKPIVRQLMIERRIAPFWRGLDDWSPSWTEHQLVAAGRGLPIPAADEIPPEELTRPISPDSTHTSNQNLNKLMVPISSRSQSAASDASANLSPSHPAFSNQSPVSPTPPSPAHSSSPFYRPRAKTVASLSKASNGTPPSDMTPREIQLPRDPYVNGQAIEVFLYKEIIECPICFVNYPPWVNKTRCCDQPICSECFVQIKRPDPHTPGHLDPSQPAPPDATAQAEALVSEPACCPYCQQPEFGVTFDPPPFRRGLAYANNGNHGIGGVTSAMSSSSSLNSNSAPLLSPNTHKRRLTSISANAPTVVTTDRVRPDWATKLSTARNHLARRSAAATALHTAAYMMGNNTEGRSFVFGSRPRFGRNRGESSPGGASGSVTPATNEAGSNTEQPATTRRDPANARRRSRMDDLEDMMMMEAIRLSLVAEEERKKKADKEAAKEAKKKAKEEKKKSKQEKKGVYGNGLSSASGSALSLNLPGLGRRRGNSGASHLNREVTPEDTTVKGKEIDRGLTAPIDLPRAGSSSGIPGARHLDPMTLATAHDSQLPSASPTAPENPSHLRQMSNASSPASSIMDSNRSSLRNERRNHGSSSTFDSPNASGVDIARSNGTPDSDDQNRPMFNFGKLAERCAENDEDKQDAAKHIEHLNSGQSAHEAISVTKETQEPVGLEESIATLKVEDRHPHSTPAEEVEDANASQDHTGSPNSSDRYSPSPEITITSETPAAVNDDGKQLGANWTGEISREITQ